MWKGSARRHRALAAGVAAALCLALAFVGAGDLIRRHLPFAGWPDADVPRGPRHSVIVPEPAADEPPRARRVPVVVRRPAQRPARRRGAVRRQPATPREAVDRRRGGDAAPRRPPKPRPPRPAPVSPPPAPPAPAPQRPPEAPPAAPARPTLVRGTVEQATAVVRETGRSLGLGGVTDPATDVLDHVAGLLP
jgi:hypothetical protein